MGMAPDFPQWVLLELPLSARCWGQGVRRPDSALVLILQWGGGRDTVAALRTSLKKSRRKDAWSLAATRASKIRTWVSCAPEFPGLFLLLRQGRPTVLWNIVVNPKVSNSL